MLLSTSRHELLLSPFFLLTHNRSWLIARKQEKICEYCYRWALMSSLRTRSYARTIPGFLNTPTGHARAYQTSDKQLFVWGCVLEYIIHGTIFFSVALAGLKRNLPFKSRVHYSLITGRLFSIYTELLVNLRKSPRFFKITFFNLICV